MLCDDGDDDLAFLSFPKIPPSRSPIMPYPFVFPIGRLSPSFITSPSFPIAPKGKAKLHSPHPSPIKDLFSVPSIRIPSEVSATMAFTPRLFLSDAVAVPVYIAWMVVVVVVVGRGVIERVGCTVADFVEREGD